jgi:hypothetical protein
MNFANQELIDSFPQARDRPECDTQEQEQEQQQQQQVLPEPQETLNSQELQDVPDVHDQEQQSSDVHPEASVNFSVNYLPLNSTYRQYLIRRDDST